MASLKRKMTETEKRAAEQVIATCRAQPGCWVPMRELFLPRGKDRNALVAAARRVARGGGFDDAEVFYRGDCFASIAGLTNERAEAVLDEYRRWEGKAAVLDAPTEPDDPGPSRADCEREPSHVRCSLGGEEFYEPANYGE